MAGCQVILWTNLSLGRLSNQFLNADNQFHDLKYGYLRPLDLAPLPRTDPAGGGGGARGAVAPLSPQTNTTNDKQDLFQDEVASDISIVWLRETNIWSKCKYVSSHLRGTVDCISLNRGPICIVAPLD